MSALKFTALADPLDDRTGPFNVFYLSGVYVDYRASRVMRVNLFR